MASVTTIQAGGRPGRAGRFRLASPVTATVLGALALVLMAVAIVLSGLVHQLSIVGSGPIVPIVVVYAGVGVVVARRQPRNPIGWILIGFIVLFLLSAVVGSYAALYYRFGHHGLPLAPVAVLLQPLWAPALLLFPVVILLFPDGRLASRRWRWVLRVYVAGGALASAAVFSPAVTAVARHDVRLDAFGDVISSGHSHSGGALAAAEVLGAGRDPGHLAVVRGPPGAQLAAGHGRAAPAAEVAGQRRRGDPDRARRIVRDQLDGCRGRGSGDRAGRVCRRASAWAS